MTKECAMRVNARFDEEAEQQVAYLAEVTGMGVSEVLRTSVQHYYDTVRAQRSGLRHLGAFIGQGDSGRADVASRYKARLAEGWAGKYAPPAAAPAWQVAEPALPPYPAAPATAGEGGPKAGKSVSKATAKTARKGRA
ncbi:hypothetical protein CK623_06130 [Vandammella animalimorsus]|uniref:Uncharacterized protein n=2 Tax=Vandammella animalimorsus TaxID=2029117 RepID=A0A2A2ARE1_9BURK|nr:hypothetical protein CK623_06130 [Vandammella animalimorsus]